MKLDKQIFRLKCREYLSLGYSFSKISKLTDTSYKYTRQICLQIQGELNEPNREVLEDYSSNSTLYTPNSSYRA